MYGFIAPTEITDEYPVIDPLYGIDGFRNVDTLNDLNNIPTLRRRAGMVVGIGGGTQYYKLNPGPWNGTITDWTIFNSGGGGGTFTGGTVTGPTIFTNGLTANTLTVNGVSITGDTYTTGGTYSNGTIDFYYNTGGGYQVVGLYTGQTSYVNSLTTGTGLSADTTTGNITIINTDPDQIVSISGGTGILTGGTYPNFIIENSLPDQTVVLNNGSNISVTGTYPNFTIDVTGLTDNDIYVTGFTYDNNNTFTISQNSGTPLTATINVVSGLTVNGNETINNGKLTINQNNGVVGVDVVNSTEAMVQVQNSPTEFSIFGRFTGETYIYSSLLVPIVFYTNGNNKRMVIDSIGNVGIGTTSPSEKLDVSGKTKTTNLQVTSGATAGYVLTAIDSSGNTKWEALGSTSNELDPVLTITGTTPSVVNIGDRFLISGGTGIWSGRTNQIAEYTGVTPTDYSYYIPVIDDVVFVTDTLTTYRFDGTNWISWRGTAILQNGNSLSTAVNIGSNNNQNLTLRTSGQTRININTSGTTNILGTTNLVQAQGLNFLTFSSSTLANSGQTMYVRQTASDQYVFGSTGIGTFMMVGPTNLVDFSNQAIKTNGAAVLGTIRTGVPYILNLNEIQSGVTSGNTTFRGILTNPTINFTGTYSGDFVGYDYQPTVTSMANGRHIAMRVTSGDVLLNTTSGNVGIGTTTPTAKLQVSGTTLLQTFTGTTGLISAATQNVLTIVGSGNTTSSPIFTVQGSSGELFSVSDSLTGSLFSVNDISGLPILEVFSDNTTLMGSYLAPSLNTTASVLATTGTTNVYSIPTSAYTGAFFDYTVSDGTNLRAGNIMSIWSGSSVNYTETQTTDFGNTSGLTFNMVVSSGNAILRTSGVTGNWTVKTIVRSI